MRSVNSLTRIVIIITTVVCSVLILLGGITLFALNDLQNISERLRLVTEKRDQLAQLQRNFDQAVVRASIYERNGKDAMILEAISRLEAAMEYAETIDQLAIDSDGIGNSRANQRMALLKDAAVEIENLQLARQAQDGTRVDVSLSVLNQLNANSVALLDANDLELDQEVQTLETQLTATYNRGLLGLLVILVGLVGLVVALPLLIRTGVVKPLNHLLTAVEAAGRGELERGVDVTSRTEIGALQSGFNTMVSSLRSQQAEVSARNRSLEAANQKQGQLLETVNALAVPILPVLDNVLVLPIVGHVDEPRARQMTSTLLDAVSHRQARTVIIDITGLATLDDEIVARLLQLMQAVGLLGAKVVLAGMSPKFARIMAHHPQALQLQSYQTLRDAVAAVLPTPTTPPDLRNGGMDWLS
jgi:anti-anti-sigma regulatory factor/HAMP domain-containing protein